MTTNLGTRVPTVKDQVHIRNAEAAHLARTLARQTGRTMNEVVLEALRQYRPKRGAEAPSERLARWHELLRQDQADRRTGPHAPPAGRTDPESVAPR